MSGALLRRGAQGAALLALGLGVWGWRQTRQLQVIRAGVVVPGLSRTVRLGFMSDLHLGALVGPARVRGWVDALMAERPDLVVLGGDLVDRSGPGAVWQLPGLLGPLAGAPLGAYWVMGNHDREVFDALGERWAVRGLPRPDPVALLAGAGLRLLQDEVVTPLPGLWLAGLDDGPGLRPQMIAELSKLPAGRAVVVAHRPTGLWQLPVPGAVGLSGHTHAGQIRFPGHREHIYGWSGRLAQHPGMPVYTSSGLGVTGVPLRLGTTPELVVLHLRPEP